jgi:predicted transposase/invertase (TIGR01784 family)
LVKVFTYLKQQDAAQPFCGVVLFGSRSLEPAELSNYLPYLKSGHLRCYSLDELEERANAPMGLSIMYLIRQPENEAALSARDLIARVKTEIGDESLRDDLIELIETVILYKLPRLSREEIQVMLQIHDIRESRVYQEAKAEGRKEGIEEGIDIANAIAKLAANNMTADEIAAQLNLDVALVRKVITNTELK